MDEMGGGLTNRANKIYRSTDGGNTWTNTYTGPTIPWPRPHRFRLFCLHVTAIPPTGDTKVGVSLPPLTTSLAYVFAARNTGNGDPGDVFYIRSTDSGVTFSAPSR